jgi:hypothetical protein
MSFRPETSNVTMPHGEIVRLVRRRNGETAAPEVVVDNENHE